MPLDFSGLEAALIDLAKNPPPDAEGAAAKWGDAMNTYAQGVVPLSPAVPLAKAALAESLAAAFKLLLAAPAAIEAAFQVFGNAVALGMQPNFTAVAPPGAVGFASLSGAFAATAEEGAAAVATLIDTWMRTGNATNNATGVFVPSWS
jgi:hypothetical protein